MHDSDAGPARSPVLQVYGGAAMMHGWTRLLRGRALSLSFDSYPSHSRPGRSGVCPHSGLLLLVSESESAPTHDSDDHDAVPDSRAPSQPAAPGRRPPIPAAGPAARWSITARTGSKSGYGHRTRNPGAESAADSARTMPPGRRSEASASARAAALAGRNLKATRRAAGSGRDRRSM